MSRVAIVFLWLMAGIFSGQALAQVAGGPSHPAGDARSQKPVIGQSVQHNIIAIEKVMGEIHQLMFQGQFTPRQASEVTEMMTRLGVMMQEMSGPQGEKLAEKHEQELKEIRRRIEIIKQQLTNSK